MHEAGLHLIEDDDGAEAMEEEQQRGMHVMEEVFSLVALWAQGQVDLCSPSTIKIDTKEPFHNSNANKATVMPELYFYTSSFKQAANQNSQHSRLYNILISNR